MHRDIFACEHPTLASLMSPDRRHTQRKASRPRVEREGCVIGGCRFALVGPTLMRPLWRGPGES